jgi:Ca2+-binding EF-hand superfamily protein
MKDKKELPITVIDFGIAKKKGSFEWLHQRTGTPEYMAPELLKKSYNCACDMWSLGIMTFELFNHHIPFPNKGTIKATIKQTLQGFQNITKKGTGLENRGPWFRECKNVPEDAKNFITQLLTVDPAERMTALEAGAHIFLTRANEKRDRSNAVLLTDLENHSNYSTLAIFTKCIINKSKQEDQIPKELYQSAQKIFEDACKTGNVTDGRLHFKAFYKHALKLTAGKADSENLIKLFIEMDTDFNEYISFDEFLIHCIWSHHKHQDDRLVKTILKFIDSNENGYINAAKLKACFENEPELAESLDANFIANVEKESDNNGNLSISSFLKILRASGTTHSDSDTCIYSEQLSFKNFCNAVDMEITKKDFEDSKNEKKDTMDDLINSHVETIISVKRKKEKTNELEQQRELSRKSSVLHSGSISMERSYIDDDELEKQRELSRKSSTFHSGSISTERSHIDDDLEQQRELNRKSSILRRHIDDITVCTIDTTTSSSNPTTTSSINNASREYTIEVLISKRFNGKQTASKSLEIEETERKQQRESSKVNDLKKSDKIPDNNEIVPYPIASESPSNAAKCFCL